MDKHILLVDDEIDIRDILTVYLSDMGFTVATAGDGQAALDHFLAHRPPIVVTDIKMPVMDGIHLLREIKEAEPQTEVIMITGHGDLDLAIKSLKYEASDFITKPINTDAFELSVRRAFEKIDLREQVKAQKQRLQQMVQEELRATRHKYHMLFEAAPCFITVQDRQLRITESNRLFREVFGDHIDRKCYQTYQHRSEACGDCPVTRTFADGNSHQAETVVTDPSGRGYNVLITTAPIRDGRGDITHVMEMLFDITAIRELQDRLTSLGLLIGSVSHGLKGLLTGLDGGIYLVRSGIKKQHADQIGEGLDIIQQMSLRIHKQVMDILYYAKDREPEYASVEIAGFVRSVLQTIEPRAAKAHVVLDSRVESDAKTVILDAKVVGSALINILENALDACTGAHRPAEPQIAFRVSADAEHVVFEISDNGIGMDAATREKIFTLFFSSKGSKGTGLGLFIAGQMIRQLGGQIHVWSEPGRGSRFTVALPMKPPSLPQERVGS